MQKEIKRRKEMGMAAIRDAFAEEGTEGSVGLFLTHHIEELESSYWNAKTGKDKPTPEDVLDIIVFHGHWDEDSDDGIDVFDFTLPDDVTNYMIGVYFDENGMVEDVMMES